MSLKAPISETFSKPESGSRDPWDATGPVQFFAYRYSFYEIRYNVDKTNYVVNFDKYDLDRKKELICFINGNAPEEVAAWDVTTIEEVFQRLTSREAIELEKDVFEVFS